MRKSNIIRLLIGSSLAVALVLVTAGPVQGQEKGSAKGGSSLLLKPIKATEDIEALEAGDAVVMSCAKCKTVTVTYVEKIKGQPKEEKAKLEHLCPGCSTKITTTGHGKAKKDEFVHICQKCGSKNVMCCALKKGALTKGMDQEKK